jgi:hypothetical protein
VIEFARLVMAKRKRYKKLFCGYPNMSHDNTIIMAIRHAEKPFGNFHGVTAKGEKDAESLIVMGWQRAGALARFFAVPPSPLSVPQFLFAAGAEKATSSERPVETLTPLSDKLGVKINTTWKKKDWSEMTDAALQAKGVALICWQHDDIPNIANKILGKDVAPKWPGDRFDMVWLFTYDASSKKYKLSQVPQLLLAGDSDKPI